MIFKTSFQYEWSTFTENILVHSQIGRLRWPFPRPSGSLVVKLKNFKGGE